MTEEKVKPTIRHWMMIKWLRIGLEGSPHIRSFMHYPKHLNRFLDQEIPLKELDALEKEFSLARVIMSNALSIQYDYPEKQ